MICLLDHPDLNYFENFWDDLGRNSFRLDLFLINGATSVLETYVSMFMS